MISEYWKKIRDFAKWLIPFLVAVFLLLGCAPAQTREIRRYDGAAGEGRTMLLNKSLNRNV